MSISVVGVPSPEPLGIVTVPVNVGEARGAFASRAVCSPDVFAIDSAASAIAVALPVDVTTPVRFAFVVTVAAFPQILRAVAVPERLVAVIEDGVPPAPLNKTGAPAEPTFTQSAVCTPVQNEIFGCFSLSSSVIAACTVVADILPAGTFVI